MIPQSCTVLHDDVLQDCGIISHDPTVLQNIIILFVCFFSLSSDLKPAVINIFILPRIRWVWPCWWWARIKTGGCGDTAAGQSQWCTGDSSPTCWKSTGSTDLFIYYFFSVQCPHDGIKPLLFPPSHLINIHFILSLTWLRHLHPNEFQEKKKERKKKNHTVLPEESWGGRLCDTELNISCVHRHSSK